MIDVTLMLCSLVFSQNAAARVGTLSDPEIKEASGVVKSRTHEGVYWVHNDSGNPPALFAVREDGSVIRRYEVSVPNVDWEDIAIDGEGHLYLGDIGNNGGRLPFRAIHRFDEPDPSQPADAPLKPTLSVHYRLPKEDRFDAESLVIDGDEALLVTKRLDGRKAQIVAIRLDPSATLFRPVLPEPRGLLPYFDEPATGADLSADGTRLAVTSLETVRIYRHEGDDWKRIGEAKFRAEGVEAVAWDGDDLVLVGEGRGVYRIKGESLRLPKDGRR